jgi:hypothetical protein
MSVQQWPDELGLPTFAPARLNHWFKLSAKWQLTRPLLPTATLSDGGCGAGGGPGLHGDPHDAVDQRLRRTVDHHLAAPGLAGQRRGLATGPQADAVDRLLGQQAAIDPADRHRSAQRAGQFAVQQHRVGVVRHRHHRRVQRRAEAAVGVDARVSAGREAGEFGLAEVGLDLSESCALSTVASSSRAATQSPARRSGLRQRGSGAVKHKCHRLDRPLRGGKFRTVNLGSGP